MSEKFKQYKANLRRKATIRKNGSMDRTAEYNGWTNWDTWNTNLMADNEQGSYNAVRKLMQQGATPEDLRDWHLQNIIGPHNQQAIQDAQEWNDIPEHDRLDHNYEALKDKNPQAADLVNGLGFGPDVSDTDPTLIDPELVNWHEIHQHLKDEHAENEEYERNADQAREQGIGWAQRGGDQYDKMRDAFYRYHGALPDEELGGSPHNHPQAYHNRVLHMPFSDIEQMPDWPNRYVDSHDGPRRGIFDHRMQEARRKAYEEYAPALGHEEAQALVERLDNPDHAWGAGSLKNWFPGQRYDAPMNMDDPVEREIIMSHPDTQALQQNGYPTRLHDLYSNVASAIRFGRPHPYTQQMQEALQQRGYSEEIQQWMAPTHTLDADGRPVPIEPQPPRQPDPSLDQPGDLTLPAGWTARRR